MDNPLSPGLFVKHESFYVEMVHKVAREEYPDFKHWIELDGYIEEMCSTEYGVCIKLNDSVHWFYLFPYQNTNFEFYKTLLSKKKCANKMVEISVWELPSGGYAIIDVSV
jgi:hypothetical protein